MENKQLKVEKSRVGGPEGQNSREAVAGAPGSEPTYTPIAAMSSTTPNRHDEFTAKKDKDKEFLLK